MECMNIQFVCGIGGFKCEMVVKWCEMSGDTYIKGDLAWLMTGSGQ